MRAPKRKKKTSEQYICNRKKEKGEKRGKKNANSTRVIRDVVLRKAVAE